MRDQSIACFLNEFSKKSMKYGVKTVSILWMVKHAEGYIKHYPDDELTCHGAEFVTSYLKIKYCNPLLIDG